MSAPTTPVSRVGCGYVFAHHFPGRGTAEQVRALAAGFDVDEVMVHPVAGAVRGTPADRSPAREETLRLLADALS